MKNLKHDSIINEVDDYVDKNIDNENNFDRKLNMDLFLPKKQVLVRNRGSLITLNLIERKPPPKPIPAYKLDLDSFKKKLREETMEREAENDFKDESLKDDKSTFLTDKTEMPKKLKKQKRNISETTGSTEKKSEIFSYQGPLSSEINVKKFNGKKELFVQEARKSFFIVQVSLTFIPSSNMFCVVLDIGIPQKKPNYALNETPTLPYTLPIRMFNAKRINCNTKVNM
jgi:hypothetical protein